MTDIASLSSYVRNMNGNEAKGVSDARQARPQLYRNPAVIDKPLESHSQPPVEHNREARKSGVGEDRRKVCQRFLRQRVPFDSRSGIDRRHHNQREGDIVEHISETA